MEDAVFIGVTEFTGFQVEQLVCLSDRVVLFFIGRKVVDIVGHLAVDHATIWSLDEAIRVDACIRCKGADQADVRTFRGLDRAHTSIVRGVNVADLEACALTRKAARTERGKTTLVRDTCRRVRLVHELREL